MKVYLAADHAGYELKNQLREHLFHSGYDVEDVGAHNLDADDDYPKYAYAAAIKLLGGADDDRAVLICGSGQGMSIAANRVRGVRAALAWNQDTAKASRRDDNANALVLPARFISADEAFKAVDAWLKTEFSSDPKYHRRLDELEELYG
jgi:ribose 5-phosphate isomerase B